MSANFCSTLARWLPFIFIGVAVHARQVPASSASPRLIKCNAHTDSAGTLRQRSGMGFQVNGGLEAALTSLPPTSTLMTSNTSTELTRYVRRKRMYCLNRNALSDFYTFRELQLIQDRCFEATSCIWAYKTVLLAPASSDALHPSPAPYPALHPCTPPLHPTSAPHPLHQPPAPDLSHSNVRAHQEEGGSEPGVFTAASVHANL